MGKRKNAPPHTLTRAEIRFLEKKVAGRSYAELAGMFNRRFGLDFTVPRLTSALGRLGLANGRDCRFQPGQVPFNKGRNGCHPGSEKGWFKPGHRPQTWQPVGTETVDKNGYIKIKVRNQKISRHGWRFKHRLVWEKAHGKIPRGHVVIFADGNKRNFAVDNLLLVSRSELAVMNRWGLNAKNGALTKIGKTVADIKLAVAARMREEKKARQTRGKRRKTCP